MAAAKSMTIGTLAGIAGVNVETIRYYERQGLMPEPPRSDSGYRLYTQDSVIRLRFIRQTQGLGFSLQEISDLLALHMSAETSCEEVRRRAQQRLRQIDTKIRSLQQMLAALQELVATCEEGNPDDICPLLETIEQRAQQDIALP